jgi:hypothetical protein
MAPPRLNQASAAAFKTFLAESTAIPYENLAQHFRDSEWEYRLVQKSVTPTADGSILVDTELHIGQTVDRLEMFDTVTLRLPPGAGPVTLVARVQIEQSLLAVVFGRFPPMVTVAPQAGPVPPPAPGQMNGGDARQVDMRDADVTLPGEDGGEYVDDTKPLIDVIAKREPDGLPIFVDVYALSDETGDVIDALLAEIRAFCDGASSLEQIDALAVKNPDALTFIKDMGDDKDKADLRSIITERKRQLTVPAAATAAANAPRRRVRASQAN